MLDQLMPAVVIATLLGAAVVGGVLFAFSSFVMKALAALPPAAGLAAMKSINVVVLNRSFLGTFVGTALLSVVTAVHAITHWHDAGSSARLVASVAYVVGTFLVTGLRNVPLNNRLAATTEEDPSSTETWNDYVLRWTRWNHVRTVAAIGAAALHAWSLIPDQIVH